MGSFGSSFGATQVGAVTKLIEPVTSMITMDDLNSYYTNDPETSSFPIEENGGVVGLISCELLGSNNPSWSKVKNKNSGNFIDYDAEIVQARDSIDYIFNKISARENPFVDLIVYHKGQYYGVLAIKDLIRQISKLRSNELAKAKNLQEFYVKENKVETDMLEYELFLDMAHDLGGDFYQNISIDEDRTLMSIYDVSGKNITAALTTSLITSFFTTLKNENLFSKKSDREIVESLNNLIIELTPDGHFVTGALFFINQKTKKITIFNMGFSQVFTFVKIDKGFRLTVTEPEFPPFGISALPESGEHVFPISVGMRIFSYSDGLTDLKDKFGKNYGDEKVKEFIKNNFTLSPKDFTPKLKKELDDFSLDAPQADDMSFLYMKFN